VREEIERLLREAARKGWRSGVETSPAEIQRVEQELNVAFPEDYREFVRQGGLEGFRGLWGPGDLVSLNRSMPVFKWFGGLVGIGNEGFNVYAYDFRSNPPIVVAVGWSSSDWADVTREADTFAQWLRESLSL
jgi:hypothetical protein